MDLADAAAGFLYICTSDSNELCREKQATPTFGDLVSMQHRQRVLAAHNSSQRWQQLAAGDRSDICPPLSPPNSSTSLPLVPRPETKAGDLCAPCKVHAASFSPTSSRWFRPRRGKKEEAKDLETRPSCSQKRVRGRAMCLINYLLLPLIRCPNG